MTLLNTLLNSGILPHDAQILANEFGSVPEDLFLDGLETIARRLAFNEPPGLIVPPSEPWATVHQSMLVIGDPETAFLTALATWSTPVQVALSGAVNVRKRDLLAWQNQSALQPGKRKKTADYLKIMRNLGYKFAFNLCTCDIEVNGDPITDSRAAEIRGKLRDAGVWEVNVAEDVYVADAWQHRYHPIKNYLMGLKFEGGDPITEVGNCFQDEYGMFQTWLRRWLIGAVARVMAGEQNRVLILDGAQGLGKDYFAHWLCSSRLEYFYEGPIMPDDKDCRLRRMWTWIWNMTEFGATSRRADRDALKAFITTKEVRDRKPYGRYDIRGTAMSSFVGTVNNEIGILTDPTGNRRFMISHILSIDWSYTRIDVDQLWAQAYELYMSGESWNLVGAERDRAEEINEFYQTVDVVEETIKKLFTIDPANTTAWLSTVDILETLKDPIRGNLRAGTEVDARRLAAALTKMGLGKPSQRKINNQPVRGYYGIQKTPTIP